MGIRSLRDGPLHISHCSRKRPGQFEAIEISKLKPAKALARCFGDNDEQAFGKIGDGLPRGWISPMGGRQHGGRKIILHDHDLWATDFARVAKRASPAATRLSPGGARFTFRAAGHTMATVPATA